MNALQRMKTRRRQRRFQRNISAGIDLSDKRLASQSGKGGNIGIALKLASDGSVGISQPQIHLQALVPYMRKRSGPAG